MRLLLVLTVAALACAQVFAMPQTYNSYHDPSQVHVVDNNYNDPSQVHVVDNNYNDPSQVHVVDNNYYDDPSHVHVVDNNYKDPTLVHVVENNPHVAEDTGFYRPTQNGNGGHFVEDSAFYRPTYGGNYEPISNGPAFVEGGRKQYDNPNLRSGK